jgi:hypothetical protein
MPIDQKQPLRVSVHGVTEKMRNTLQYFFHGPCNDYCEMVEEDSSELTIIDLDGLNGQQSLQNHRIKNPEKPVILLSINNRDIEDGILVQKPLKPEKLISALKTAHQKVLSNIGLSETATEKKSPQVAQPEKVIAKREEKVAQSDSRPIDKSVVHNNSDAVKVLKQTLATEEKIENAPVTATNTRSETHKAAKSLGLHDELNYIGSAPDIGHDDITELAKAQYDPDKYFQGYINQAVIKAENADQAVLLSLPDGWIVIQPSSHSVFINIQESKLHAFSALPITDQTITQSLLEESNLSEYSQQSNLMDLEQLIWKSSIWSSRGRVPIGTSLTLPISFQHWPNLSRLLLSPHALRIAALWSDYPCSLLDTAKTLQIPQRYVFAFYSACNAIGIASVKQDSTDDKGMAIPVTKNRKRAFFGRILERLKGLH